jgi:hypothetical protein
MGMAIHKTGANRLSVSINLTSSRIVTLDLVRRTNRHDPAILDRHRPILNQADPGHSRSAFRSARAGASRNLSRVGYQQINLFHT